MYQCGNIRCHGYYFYLCVNAGHKGIRPAQSHVKYLFVLEVGRELIALGERARPFDGLLLSLLAEDGLRVLELGPTGSLWPRLDPLAVQGAFESVRADGRPVGHWTLAIGGSTVQGRATVAGPSIPFHTVEKSKFNTFREL